MCFSCSFAWCLLLLLLLLSTSPGFKTLARLSGVLTGARWVGLFRLSKKQYEEVVQLGTMFSAINEKAVEHAVRTPSSHTSPLRQSSPWFSSGFLSVSVILC